MQVNLNLPSDIATLSLSSALNPPKLFADSSINIDPHNEHQLPNGVTIYGENDKGYSRIAIIVYDYPDVFIDKGLTVGIPEEEEWIPIRIKPGFTSKPAHVYPVGPEAKKITDDTFDATHRQGKITWSTQPTPYSYPVFVLWKESSGSSG